jgi:hypothetical protein
VAIKVPFDAIDRFFSATQLDGIFFSKKDALGRSLYFPSGVRDKDIRITLISYR